MKFGKILILTLLVFLFLFQVCLAKETYFNFTKTYNISFNKTQNALAVLINNTSGSVELCGWDKPECKININYKIPETSEVLARKLAEEKTRVKYEKKELIISLESLFEYFKQKSSFFKKYSASADIIVYAPKSVVYDLTLDIVNGNISAKDIKCSNANFNSTNGKITVNKISGGIIDADVVNGAIAFDGVLSEKINANITNGNIFIGNITAVNVKADAVNGQVKFKGKASDVKIDTTNGGIDADILPKEGTSIYKLDAETGTININIAQNKNTGIKIKDADSSTAKVSVDIKNFNITKKKEDIGAGGYIEGESKNFAGAKNKIIISATSSTGAINIKAK